MRSIILSIFFILWVFASISQTLVNKYVLDPFGNPTTDIEWSATAMNINEEMITTGHTVTGVGQIEILTTKMSSEGELLWQSTWYPEGDTSQNYGIAVNADTSGNIYVAGVTTTGEKDSMDYVLIKYAPDGTELWVKIIGGQSGKMDIPSAITTDAQGNVFVTGVSTGDSTLTDYLTLKLDKNNGNILWQERYDNQGFLDIAVDIVVNDSGNIIIAGTSSSDTLSWDYKTLSYNGNDGNLIDANTISNGAVGFETPKAIVKDSDGNFYITGNYDTITEEQNIKIIKLDAEFNILWSASYDGSGLEDDASSIQLAPDGSIRVTGYATNTNSQKELLILAYASNGDLLWEQRRRPSNSIAHVIGKRSTVDESGSIYVAGEITNGANSTTLVVKFDQSGRKRWEQRHRDGIDIVSGVHKAGDEIYVFGQNIEHNDHKYYTLKFREYERSNPTTSDPGKEKPRYKSDELVVKFDRNQLLINNIDNLNITHGDASTWLTQAAIDTIETKVSLERATFTRIFKQLKSTHKTSRTRLGETIAIPDFWAVFIVEFPNMYDKDQMIADLESFFPVVKYAHPNYVSELLSAPNDSIYPKQHALAPTLWFDSVDINIEPLWDVETGKPYIKIGLIDSGTDWDHEDLMYDSAGTNASVVVNGWDFESNSPLKSLSNPDTVGHGTKMSGIFGAIRNNEIGVAGVAGGYPNPNGNYLDRGVSLYSQRAFAFQYFDTDLEYIADAIVNTAIENDTINNAYGVHIMNNSWGLDWRFPNQYTPINVQLLQEAVYFTNRNKVIFVAARGNEPIDSIIFPACYDDDWVINVGGTGIDGHWSTTVRYGHNVDVAAPSHGGLIKTIITGGGYGNSSATSAACSYVSGTAGLLLSYHNTPSPTYNNLAPEDVEFVLQKSAYNVNKDNDIDSTGYDIYTGFGRLDAGKALNLIKNPQQFLVHYGTDAYPNNKFSSLVNSNISINLTSPYENSAGQNFAPDTYSADVYQVSATIDHSLTSTDIILYAWERHSSSTLFPYTQDGEDLEPYEKVDLINVTQNQATLQGYVYELKDSTGASMGWIPFNVTDLDKANLAYTLLIKNSLLTKQKEVLSALNLYLSPNPTKEYINIDLHLKNSAHADLSIYDMRGNKLQQIYNNIAHKRQKFLFDCSALPAGVYCVEVIIRDELMSKLFVKL